MQPFIPRIVPLIFVFIPLHLAAQNAELTGLVTDPAGARVTQARVEVTDRATLLKRTTSTDAGGLYYFTLPSGTYDIDVSAQAFRPLHRAEVTLDVAHASRLDFALELGKVNESITVTSGTEALQQNASVQNVIDTDDLEHLPVNGRNYTHLIALMPGTSDINSAQQDGTVSGTAMYSVNGNRVQDNSYTIDGIDNRFFHFESPGATPPMDSIQEFSVSTNSSAEYGGAAGSIVQAVVKSGTRNLHGTLYEYLRNDRLDANEFFANLNNLGLVGLKQNQFGAALGGPVYVPKIYPHRDKLFFFFNYEGLRNSTASTLISTVPTAAEDAGNFQGTGKNVYDPLSSVTNAKGQITRALFPNNTIPASELNPGMQYFLKTFLPAPNLAGTSNGTASNFVNTTPSTNNRDTFVGRMDYRINDNNNVFFRVLNQQVAQLAPQSFPVLNNLTSFDSLDLAAGSDTVLSPTSTLQVRVGYHNPYAPVNTTNNLGIQRNQFLQSTNFQILDSASVPYPILPTITASGYFTYEESLGPSEDHVTEAAANYTKVLGANILKLGGNYFYREYFHDASNNTDGELAFTPALTQSAGDSHSGSALATLLLGYPSTVYRGLGDAAVNARSQAFDVYGQYEWQIARRLKLTLGGRYEFSQPPYDINNQLGTLLVTRSSAGAYAGTLLWAGQNTLTGQPANQGGYGRALQISQWLNFSPRVGLVAQLDSKTVLRSGFGIFYESTFFQEAQDKRKFYPYNILQTFTANSGATPDTSVTQAGPSFSNTTAIGGYPQDPNKATPYAQEWNLFIQRSLAKGLTAQIGYVGQAGRHLIGYNTFNTATSPGPGAVQPRRLLPDFGDIYYGSNDYISNYNALQAQVVQRYANGLQFNVNYTWGHSLDDDDSLAEFRDQNPYNHAADYSSSSYDIRQMFQVSMVYDLPFGRGRRFGAAMPKALDWLAGGWSFEAIARLQTGAPVNVVLGTDQANVGSSYQRPDVSGNPNDGPQTRQQWFTTSAFSLPALYTFGNAGAYLVRADGRHNADLSLHKFFSIREGQKLDARAEFFNATNSVSMGNPNATYTSSSFGQVTSATPAREIQIALRYRF
jgi:hypothetical protein